MHRYINRAYSIYFRRFK